MSEFDEYERFYLPITMTTRFRCKRCGVESDITDYDLRTAIRIELNHQCNVLPKGTDRLALGETK